MNISVTITAIRLNVTDSNYQREAQIVWTTSSFLLVDIIGGLCEQES